MQVICVRWRRNNISKQTTKDFADLGCAIHWFVPDFLQASKLPSSGVAGLSMEDELLCLVIFPAQTVQTLIALHLLGNITRCV